MNNTANQNNTLREEDLHQFTGTETWYRTLFFRDYLYTDGVRHVAEEGGAYWLIDKIFASAAHIGKLKNEEFQVWKLIRNKEGEGAKIICEDGNYNELYREEIDYTDFPLKSIELYLINKVLLLPSEY
jgi:hypothetical protein